MMMSREAVPIGQSILKIGIAAVHQSAGFARFGTVPEVIVSIVLHS
jgi:hypothetical protein